MKIIEQTSDHDAMWLLIPWYVNGRLDERQHAQVDAHLSACQACQHEVLTQRNICQSMAASNPDVEQLPTASLRRLLQNIDAGKTLSHEMPMDTAMPPPVTRMQQVFSWRHSGRLAASLAIITATAMGVAMVSHSELPDKNTPANYYTVTSAAPRVPSEVIRAVFTPTITVADMQRILTDAQLHIVAGPSAAGVYSLAKTGTRSVDESLLQLRQYHEVLFAEPSAIIDQVAAK